MYIEIKNSQGMVPTNDYIFKRIFGHKGNEEITKGFISSIINRKIESINLDGNTILEKDLQDDKLGILDIKAKLDDKIFCDIEMQVVNQKSIEKRMLYYWSKLYISGITSGKDYMSLNKTISILIADFELHSLREIVKFHTEWKIREKDYKKTVLTEMLEIHIIELPKLERLIKSETMKEKSKLVIWLKFLLNPENVEVTEMENNEDIRKAKDEFEKLQRDEYEKRLAELRMKYVMDSKSIERCGFDSGFEQGIQEGIQEGIKEGIKEGIQEGINQKAIEVAKKLLKKGMKIDEIIEITGLTKEELNHI